MRFLAWVSGRVLALASLLFAVGGAILLFQGEAYSGVGLLMMGSLFCLWGFRPLPKLSRISCTA